LLSSLVHSVLYKKSRGADSKDDDDGCNERQLHASAEDTLHSLVERMAKCEPEDFELVRFSLSPFVLPLFGWHFSNR